MRSQHGGGWHALYQYGLRMRCVVGVTLQGPAACMVLFAFALFVIRPKHGVLWLLLPWSRASIIVSSRVHSDPDVLSPSHPLSLTAGAQSEANARLTCSIRY